MVKKAIAIVPRQWKKYIHKINVQKPRVPALRSPSVAAQNKNLSICVEDLRRVLVKNAAAISARSFLYSARQIHNNNTKNTKLAFMTLAPMKSRISSDTIRQFSFAI